MANIWLKHYDPGVPSEVDTGEFASLADLFSVSVARYRDRPAYYNMGRQISFGELDQLTARFASYLQHHLGLKQGDRVALMMPNILQYPIALFGVLRAGMVAVNVNPLYTPRELAHQISDSGAQTIVILENFCHTLERTLTETPIKNIIVTSLGDMLSFPKSFLVDFMVRRVKKLVPAWHIPGSIRFKSCIGGRSAGSFTQPKLGPEDTAFLQYTGGTTGVSKGAILTHGSLLASVTQFTHWISRTLKPGDATGIVALPLYHVAALVCQCLSGLKWGTNSVLITNPRDIGGLVKEMRRHRFTAIGGVNTLYNALLNHPDIGSVDFSNLTVSFSGAMAMQQVVADKWKKVTGCTMVEAYGLTETCGISVMNPISIDDCRGMIGIPIPSTDVELRDDTGKPVGFNTPGELCIRGPQVMRGYLNRPEETAAVLDDRNFLATGDIAVMNEDGFLKLVDRKKDMILVSGFNVFPNEVEDVLSRHPGIMEVAAIGIADPHSGEAVMVCVVKKDPELTEAAVISFARESLTGYKLPKKVVFIAELPKSNVGKILRRELRDKMRASLPS